MKPPGERLSALHGKSRQESPSGPPAPMPPRFEQREDGQFAKFLSVRGLAARMLPPIPERSVHELGDIRTPFR